MKRRYSALAILAPVLAAATCAGRPPPATGSLPPGPLGHLEPGPDISPQTHAELRKRMRRHSRQMNELVWAVVLVDYPATRLIAESIANDADLDDKAMAEAADVAEGLPRGFFTMHASLRTKAGEIARAASVRDVRSMSASYGSLSQVCVDCHAVYGSSRQGVAPPSVQ